jgi:hypothetical protein
MNTKFPDKLHYCSYCEIEWKRKDLLKLFCCPECKKFTKPHSKSECDFDRLTELTMMSKIFNMN